MTLEQNQMDSAVASKDVTKKLGEFEREAFSPRHLCPLLEICSYEALRGNKALFAKAQDDVFQAIKLLRLQYHDITPVGYAEAKVFTVCPSVYGHAEAERYHPFIPVYKGPIYVYRARRTYDLETNSNYFYIADSWNLIREFLHEKRDVLGREGAKLLKNINNYDLARKLLLFNCLEFDVQFGTISGFKDLVIPELVMKTYSAAQAVVGHLVLNQVLKAYL